ncbi:hypothetical protein [uncultured Oscillibacter sp.]|nr:hypothetical protein [uncultured Oscillibacter sp.]
MEPNRSLVRGSMALLGLALSVLRGDPVGRLVDCAWPEMPGLRTAASGE